MPLDQPIDMRSRRLADTVSDSHRLKRHSALFAFLLTLVMGTISSAQVQQRDTLPTQLSTGSSTTLVDSSQLRTWYQHLNDAQSAQSNTGTMQLDQHASRDENPSSARSSAFIPYAFLVVVLISGGLTAFQMPQVWRKGLAFHQRNRGTVTFGGKVDAFVGCFFTMIVGLLAVPLLLATAVDLGLWLVSRVVGG